MYILYILYSESRKSYYTGQTEDLKERLSSHESGMSPFTSIAKDWKLVYTEEFQTRTEAIKRENEIKRKKSKRYIEWIIAKSKEGD